MQQQSTNRIAITIVDGTQSKGLIKALNKQGFYVTLLDAIGGFLHESLVTLLIGMTHTNLPQFFSIIRQKCPSRARYVPMGVELSMAPGYPMMIEARVGGATVLILPVEQFIQL